MSDIPKEEPVDSDMLSGPRHQVDGLYSTLHHDPRPPLYNPIPHHNPPFHHNPALYASTLYHNPHNTLQNPNRNTNSSPSPEMYSDSQPLDLVKRKKDEKRENQDVEKYKRRIELALQMKIHANYPYPSTSGIERSSPQNGGESRSPNISPHHRTSSSPSPPPQYGEYPFRSSSPERIQPPQMSCSPAKSPQSYPSLSHAPITPPTPFHANLIAQINANPILLSKFQSVLVNNGQGINQSLFQHNEKSRSPPAADFARSSPEPNHPTPTPSTSGYGGLGAGGMALGGLCNLSASGLGGMSGMNLSAGSLSGAGLGASLNSLSGAALSGSALGGVGIGGVGSGLSGIGGAAGFGGALSGLINSPLSSPGYSQSEMFLNQHSHERYLEFRAKMLVAKAKRNGTRKPTPNPDQSNMDRPTNSSQGVSSTSQGSDNLAGNGEISEKEDFDNSDMKSDTETQKANSLDGNENEGSMDSCYSSATGATKRRKGGDGVKDQAYWERRRKNNEAAKRSRDARRAKEDETAIRAAFLERENIELKYKVDLLKKETAQMRCVLYNSN